MLKLLSLKVFRFKLNNICLEVMKRVIGHFMTVLIIGERLLFEIFGHEPP